MSSSPKLSSSLQAPLPQQQQHRGSVGSLSNWQHLQSSGASGGAGGTGPRHSMSTLVTAISAFLHSPNTIQLSRGTPSSPAPPDGSHSVGAASSSLRGVIKHSGERNNNNNIQSSTAPIGQPSTSSTRASSPDAGQRALIREMFDGIDRRGRGFISVSATRRVLSSFGVTLDHTDMDELLREVATLPHAPLPPSHQSTTATSTAPEEMLRAAKTHDAVDDEVAENESDEDPFGVSNDFEDDDEGRTHSQTASSSTDCRHVFHPKDVLPQSSMANLPYRQRYREQHETKDATLFQIVCCIFRGGSEDKTVHHRSAGVEDVGMQHNVTNAIGVVPESRLIEVGATAASGVVRRGSFSTDGNPPPPSQSTNAAGPRTTATHHRAVPPTTSLSGSKPTSPPSVRVTFDMFYKMVLVWQTAARFRQFEERTMVAKDHLSNGTRTRHFLPDSTMLFVWQCLVLSITTLLIFAALSVFSYQEKHVPRYLSMTAPLELLATVVFAVDIYMALHTTRIVRGPSGEHRLDDSPIGIAKAYVWSPWLWIDLFCMIPFRFCFYAIGSDFSSSDFVLTYDASSGAILSGGEGCVRCGNDIDEMRTKLLLAKIFLVLRCIKYVEHIHYFKESRLVLMTQNYVTRNFVFVQLFSALSTMCVLIQIFATIYLSMHPRTDAEVSDGGGLVLARAYYLVLTCFATVGFGDIAPITDNDRFFFIALILVAFIVNASVIGEAVSFFQRSDIESRKSESLLELLAMCEYFCIPEGLQSEIVSFYSHTATSDIMNNYGRMFETIPMELRKGLQLMSRLRLIRQLPYFDDLHRSARLLLCNCLEKATYCPEQYVIYAGEIGNEMFFLNHGFVDIFGAGGLYLVTLRHGNYFGEMAIIDPEPQKRAADVKAITYCEIYVLSKDSFQDLLGKYPRLHSAVTEIAEARRKQTQQVTVAAAAGTKTSSKTLRARDDGEEGLGKKAVQNSSGSLNGLTSVDKPMTIVVNGSAPNDGRTRRSAATSGNSSPDSKAVGNAGDMVVEDCGRSPQTLAIHGRLVPSGRASPFDGALGFGPVELPSSHASPRGMNAVAPLRTTSAGSPQGEGPQQFPTPAAAGAGGRRRSSIFGTGGGGSNLLMAARHNSRPAIAHPSSSVVRQHGLLIEQSILSDDELETACGSPEGDQREVAALIDSLEEELAELLEYL